MDYFAYLHKEQNSDFGVSFPDFPGCVTAGKTLEEARELASEVLKLHIAGMMEDGDALPDPSTLNELANDPAMQGAMVFPVSAEAPGKTVRVNITAQASQIESIDKLAKARNMTRSAYIVQSLLMAAPQEQTGAKYKQERQSASEGMAFPSLVPKEGVKPYPVRLSVRTIERLARLRSSRGVLPSAFIRDAVESALNSLERGA